MPKIKCEGPCEKELYSPEEYDPKDEKDNYYWQKITWRGAKFYYIRRRQCKICFVRNDRVREAARNYRKRNKVVIKFRNKMKDKI
jgi:hypothetical protein